jgi:RNA polymerase sigma-70 factor (ECF subfamily)
MSVAPSASAGRSSTSYSLLERALTGDQSAWAALVEIYGPLVYFECRAKHVPPEDAPDVVQEVFRKVFKNLYRFRHDGPGDSFRAWLATIARNSIHDYYKARRRRPDLPVGGTEMHGRVLNLPDIDELESTITARPGSSASVVQKALEHIRPEFEEHTWKAFWLTAVDGLSPAEVAAKLGVNKCVVYQAKSRVLRRLRQELEGLMG